MEPCPRLSMCSSFSDVLNSRGDAIIDGMMRPRAKTASHVRTVRNRSRDLGDSFAKPAQALTTVFNECRPHSPTPLLPPHRLSEIQPDLCRLEDLVNPGCSRGEDDAVCREKTPGSSSSLAAGLPTEVIQKILFSLHPADFNAARHICRSWFVNSLERSGLETMLRRGGWSSSIPRVVSLHRALDDHDSVSPEWQISKRLSRECALGPDWTGNGLGKSAGGPLSSRRSKASLNLAHKPPADSKDESVLLPEPNLSNVLNGSAFVHTSSVDFSDVAVHYPGVNSAGTVFTVSRCGRFLMAANGCLIYVYELNKSSPALSDSDNGAPSDPGSLRPVTSILCPRRVLACSMDTSSHRYAIAVLLDGRMGLVCEISPCNVAAASHSSPRPESSWSVERMGNPSFLDRVSLNSSSSSNIDSVRPSSEPPFVFPGIAATPPLSASHTPDKSCWQDMYNADSPDAIRTEGPSSRHPSLPRAHISPGSRTQSILPPHVEREASLKSMPIENGPRSLYRNLCSDDDPPRSVAICPQRRCVAFGCSAGIELHWVDALTGQDLNRWFPLTAPSDYLFFLPPRRSVDSAKKLRLISSAARPGERAAISERAFGGRTKNSPFWERLGWGAGSLDDEEIASQTQGMVSRLRNEVRTRGLSGRIDYSDHYRAIPLSDGYHILFTDPSTGLLCLGSDAPVGGPTKLLRKIWFQGPKGEGSPVAYAGGSDLTHGVRVVAAFGGGAEQKIWFFSVAGDVFSGNNQSSQMLVQGSWLKSGTNCQNQNLEWMNWWPDDGLQGWLSHSQDPVPGSVPRSVWPVKIRGQEIGTLSDLVDLAIDSGPSMTIWAFSSEGVAKVWQIDDGHFDGSVTQRLVARDGTMRELDGEGDVEMSDAPPSSSFSSPDLLVHPLPLDAESPDVEMSDAPSYPSTPDVLTPPLSHRPESFDGTASFMVASSIVFTTRAERRFRFHHTLRTVNYDADADILMDNLEGSETEEDASQGSFDDIAVAQAGNFVYETFHRSETVHGADFVEGLTGIARLDIEIH
jgi:hypothetical protein